MQPVSQLSMRLTSLWSAIIFDTILIFQNGSRSSFLFYISFIPNNWIITSVPHLTSLLSSVMLLVCTESITSSTSLVFSSISLYQFFLGSEGLASCFSSLVQQFLKICFVSLLCHYCSDWSIVPHFLYLSLRPPHPVQYVVLLPAV